MGGSGPAIWRKSGPGPNPWKGKALTGSPLPQGHVDTCNGSVSRFGCTSIIDPPSTLTSALLQDRSATPVVATMSRLCASLYIGELFGPRVM